MGDDVIKKPRAGRGVLPMAKPAKKRRPPTKKQIEAAQKRTKLPTRDNPQGHQPFVENFWEIIDEEKESRESNLLWDQMVLADKIEQLKEEDEKKQGKKRTEPEPQLEDLNFFDETDNEGR
ncbi:MAG TPA: hypothetical protein VIX91_22435 [Candidatus Acidoferrum sp.]